MTPDRRAAQQARYRQIADAPGRHGLGYRVGTAGLDRFVPFHHGLLGHPRRTAPYTRLEHVGMALDDLAVRFVKLGQIRSTPADLMPAELPTRRGGKLTTPAA